MNKYLLSMLSACTLSLAADAMDNVKSLEAQKSPMLTTSAGIVYLQPHYFSETVFVASSTATDSPYVFTPVEQKFKYAPGLKISLGLQSADKEVKGALSYTFFDKTQTTNVEAGTGLQVDASGVFDNPNIENTSARATLSKRVEMHAVDSTLATGYYSNGRFGFDANSGLRYQLLKLTSKTMLDETGGTAGATSTAIVSSRSFNAGPVATVTGKFHLNKSMSLVSRATGALLFSQVKSKFMNEDNGATQNTFEAMERTYTVASDIESFCGVEYASYLFGDESAYVTASIGANVRKTFGVNGTNLGRPLGDVSLKGLVAQVSVDF